MEPLSALRQLNPQIDRLAIERDSGGTHRQNGHEHTGDGEKKPIIRGAWRIDYPPDACHAQRCS
jgi:hypothetical protein